MVLTEEEKRRINAEHEAWHCAALLELGLKVKSVDLSLPGTFWNPDPQDHFATAVVLQTPAVAMPSIGLSDKDHSDLAELDPETVPKAWMEAGRLVGEVIDQRGIDAITEALLVEGKLDSERVELLYRSGP